MSDKNFDLIVIGGGPGGYVAAIRASQLGMKVGLVEANHLGGICLNWGCIPTKALLRSSEVYHMMKNADAYGLSADNVSFDLKKVVARSRGVATQLSGGIGHLLKKNKVTVFDAYAKLAGGGKVTLSKAGEKDGKVTDTVSAKHIVVATGARARVLPGLESSFGPIKRRWCRTQCRKNCS
jgi:dihydrolipoamide dehydrogenase